MLAELVAAGSLPPVAERLPPEPLVVTPTNTVGTYGGTFFGASMAPETTSDFQLGMVTGLLRYRWSCRNHFTAIAETQAQPTATASARRQLRLSRSGQAMRTRQATAVATL